PDGTLYVAGRMPALPSRAPDRDAAARFDGYLSRLTPDGKTVLSTTIFGGSGDDEPASVAVGAGGLVHVAGTTSSSDLPARLAVHPGLAGPSDAFVLTFSADGAALVRSTCLGGPGADRGAAIAEAPDATLWVVGTLGGADGIGRDGFVAAL